MRIRKPAEQYNGHDSWFEGPNSANLTRYYLDGDCIREVPLTPEELTAKYSASLRMSYTNKQGETYYSSDAETTGDVVAKHENHILMHHKGVIMGKKRVERFAIWELDDNGNAKKPGIPEKHFQREEYEVIRALMS